MLLIFIIKLATAQEKEEESGSDKWDQTSVICALDEIVVNVGSYSVNGPLTAISLGTCGRLSPQFESNTTIRVKTINNMETWSYQCGFKRSENATNIIFESELTFIENRQTNPFGIWAPRQLSNGRLEVYTQSVQCLYKKLLHAKELVQLVCTKCEGCYYNVTNFENAETTYTCDG